MTKVPLGLEVRPCQAPRCDISANAFMTMLPCWLGASPPAVTLTASSVET